MDDKAGGYYDQHVYITHKIANMVVSDMFVNSIQFVYFVKQIYICIYNGLIQHKYVYRIEVTNTYNVL